MSPILPRFILLTAFLLGGCSAAPAPEALALPSYVLEAGQKARLRNPERPLECVPYARALSGIGIRGDAWTWWQQAEGRYQRHGRPEAGSVLVLSRSQRLKAGHLAVVEAILDDRTVLVSHANWLNRGRIHERTPVRDVSPGNDWSLVRIWYLPGRTLGARSYPAYGFIRPLRHAA